MNVAIFRRGLSSLVGLPMYPHYMFVSKRTSIGHRVLVENVQAISQLSEEEEEEEETNSENTFAVSLFTPWFYFGHRERMIY